VTLPAVPYLHVFVAVGSVLLEGAGVLTAGDAVRITGSDGERVSAIGPAEVMVWEMHSTLAS
jgi:hypothetical protein